MSKTKNLGMVGAGARGTWVASDVFSLGVKGDALGKISVID